MLHFFKSGRQKEYTAQVQKAIAEIDAGNESYLPVAYQLLVNADARAMEEIAEAVAAYMRRLNPAGILHLNEHFRQYTSMEWWIEWRKVDIDIWEKTISDKDNFLWLVRLGTMHPNGWFREKCIRKLEGDKASAKFLLLRLNDWVEPVRKAAWDIYELMPDLNFEEAMDSFPYMEKLVRSERVNISYIHRIENRLIEILQANFAAVLHLNMKIYDERSRKYLYRLIMEHKLSDQETIKAILKREKSGQCQKVIMTLFMDQYELSPEEAEAFLSYKGMVVQRMTLEYKYGLLGNYWDGVEKMLLSPYASVREFTRYILKRHTEIDILQYYRERLDTEKRTICILGIGESGKAEDAEILMPFLEDKDAATVRNAIHAISLLKGDDARELYWKLLTDGRPVVMRAAYREMAANNIAYGAKQVFELYRNTDSEALKEKLSCQFQRENSWERLPYLLQLYWCENDKIQETVRKCIARRSMYGKVSWAEAERILTILHDEANRIPEEVQKSIAFDLKYVTVKPQ